MICITVNGRLGAEPELKEINGTNVCNFRIAADTWIKKENITTWFSCEVWGQRADCLSNNFVKWYAISVDGNFWIDDVSDNNGNQRSYANIKCQLVEFVPGSQKKKPTEAKPVAKEPVKEDDIPF